MSDLLIIMFMFQLGSRERMGVTSNSENLSLDAGGYNSLPPISSHHVEKGVFLNVCIR